jgi:hypothetical protein
MVFAEGCRAPSSLVDSSFYNLDRWLRCSTRPGIVAVNGWMHGCASVTGRLAVCDPLQGCARCVACVANACLHGLGEEYEVSYEVLRALHEELHAKARQMQPAKQEKSRFQKKRASADVVFGFVLCLCALDPSLSVSLKLITLQYQVLGTPGYLSCWVMQLTHKVKGRNQLPTAHCQQTAPACLRLKAAFKSLVPAQKEDRKEGLLLQFRAPIPRTSQATIDAAPVGMQSISKQASNQSINQS